MWVHVSTWEYMWVHVSRYMWVWNIKYFQPSFTVWESPISCKQSKAQPHISICNWAKFCKHLTLLQIKRLLVFAWLNSLDLEDDVTSGLEELLVQSDAGGRHTPEGSPRLERDVSEEVGEKGILCGLPQPHLNPQTHLAGGPCLTMDWDEVTAEQKWIEDLLSVLISPESSKVSHYYHSDPPFLLSVEVSSKQSYVICPGYAWNYLRDAFQAVVTSFSRILILLEFIPASPQLVIFSMKSLILQLILTTFPAWNLGKSRELINMLDMTEMRRSFTTLTRHFSGSDEVHHLVLSLLTLPNSALILLWWLRIVQTTVKIQLLKSLNFDLL